MQNVINGLDWSIVYNFFFSAIPALICIVIHEICHGWVAYKLGDITAKTQGRLSLNPLRHIDPVGLLMLIIFHFGWAKPVSVNMQNFKNPKRDMALTSLAGPVSNILLAFVLLIFYRILLQPLMISSSGVVALKLILTTAQISVYLGIFNLIPIPPMDGSKVLFSFLPNDLYLKLMRYERYGMIILMVIIFSGYFNSSITSAFNAVFKFIFSIVFIGYK